MNFDVINILDLGEFTNPNAYVSIDLGLDPNSGDLVINADGTINNVSGTLKLIQDIKLFLLSPLRTSIIDPTWGNPVLADIGQAPMNETSIEQQMQGAIASLKNFKDNEQKLRGFPLEGSELIGVVNGVNVTSDGQGHYQVYIVLTDGEQNEQSVVFEL